MAFFLWSEFCGVFLWFCGVFFMVLDFFYGFGVFFMVLDFFLWFGLFFMVFKSIGEAAYCVFFPWPQGTSTNTIIFSYLFFFLSKFFSFPEKNLPSKIFLFENLFQFKGGSSCFVNEADVPPKFSPN